MDRHEIVDKREYQKVCGALKDVLGDIKQFASSAHGTVSYSTRHDCPSVEVSLQSRLAHNKKYLIHRVICVTAGDYKYPPIYRVWVVISNSYGFKEWFAFFPFLKKRCKDLKRIRWEKTIGILDSPIDLQLLRVLLEQSIQVIEKKLSEIDRLNLGRQY